MSCPACLEAVLPRPDVVLNALRSWKTTTMGRASKDKRDIYYRKAKEEGYRARSAYKLLQIDEEFHIFAGVTRAVDLCAAPGSWSQVLAARLPKREGDACSLVAVDLQDISPIEGVAMLQGDITTTETANEVVRLLGCKAGLVVCDGAPDVTGLHELDEYVQHQLLLAALNITTFVLERGGTFVSKVFRGPNTPFLCAKMQLFFRNVTVVKPKSSRNASMESFILCQDYCAPDGYVPSMIDPVQVTDFFPSATNAKVVPFLACGSLAGFDADMCYDAEAGAPSLLPVQPPMAPPYKEAVDARKKRDRPPQPSE
jgi:tRNA (cytidine32/guanosine34-2'-O)-methyltransferase